MARVQLVSDVTYEFPVTIDGSAFKEAEVGDEPGDILTFTMRKLKHDETSAIDDATMVTKGNTTHYLVGKARISKLKKCVVGWVGMEDDEGNEIKFSHANLNALPGPLIKVLDKHIIDVNGLREDDQKN